MSIIRLNKALAQAGVVSRRKADELIQGGHVTVNGTIILELGTKIDSDVDQVIVQGKKVMLDEVNEDKHSYVMLHKPVQVVSTAKDPEGRPTVLDFLPATLKSKRLYPIGRLDYFSEGLLLLTNDGELTNRLTHPKYHQEKVYIVRLRTAPSIKNLETMRAGMRLAEGEKLAPVTVEQLENNTILRMVLRQGVNRQIRRMCRDLNLTILALKRVQIGPLSLGDLPKGTCRPLSPKEISMLKLSVGLPR